MKLRKLLMDYLIDHEDAVVAVKDAKGKVKLHQAINLTEVIEAGTGLLLDVAVSSAHASSLYIAVYARCAYGRMRGRHRTDRVGCSLLAGAATGWHVDLQRRSHTLSRLRQIRGRLEWSTTVAGGRSARDPDGTFDSVINYGQGDENIAEWTANAWSYPARLAL